MECLQTSLWSKTAESTLSSFQQTWQVVITCFVPRCLHFTLLKLSVEVSSIWDACKLGSLDLVDTAAPSLSVQVSTRPINQRSIFQTFTTASTPSLMPHLVDRSLLAPPLLVEVLTFQSLPPLLPAHPLYQLPPPPP